MTAIREITGLYHTYILFSKSADRYYCGHTDNLQDRLIRHNAGKSKATRSSVPWNLCWSKSCHTRAQAMKAENWIKRMKSRELIERIISREQYDNLQ